MNQRNHQKVVAYLFTLPPHRATVEGMHQPTQVLYLHGGMTFPTYEEYRTFLATKELTIERLRLFRSWKDRLQDTLGGTFDVLAPRMPNGTNAVYEEWETYFSRILTLLRDDPILIGHSLGGVFLAKHLSTHDVPVRLRATLLVAAPFCDDLTDESLGDFVPPASLERFKAQGGALYVYHSTDDPVVPFSHGEGYAAALTGCTFRALSGYGHFNTETFPELVADVRSLVS